MINACVSLTASTMPDISHPLIRLQDIPRKTLRMYGIVFDDDDDDDDPDDSSDDDIGTLIIDETALLTPSPQKSPALPQSWSREELYPCNLCSLIVNNREVHKSQHCKQPGCPSWIVDRLEMIIHVKNHNNHPTKPFWCAWCKKRYKFHLHMLRHLKYCKSLKKRSEAAKCL